MSERRRVVITGMGVLTPLGLSLAETWENAKAGKSGVTRITQFDASAMPTQIAGELKGFKPEAYMPAKEARRMARCSQVALAATQQALADAGLTLPLANPERVGVAVGVGMGGMEWTCNQARVYWEKGVGAVSPFALTAALPNIPTYHVSIYTGAQGAVIAPVAACASGTQAIGEAAEFIRHGRADVMFAGGTEALVYDIAIGAFCAMRAMSTRNDEPERASRPFDRDRDGFVFAEGAGILVLESLDHALARGARIYAEVLGHASSLDAYHIAQPDPEGRGAQRAMRWALEDAGIAPEEVDYINTHGTGTPLGDPIETFAVKSVFGAHAYKLALSSTKSMMGHTMGAAGAIESVITVMTLVEGIITPTINLDNPDPQCDLDYTPNVARKADVRIAMKNAFGLGGQNSSLILKRWEG